MPEKTTSNPILTQTEQSFFIDAMLHSLGGLPSVKINYASLAEARGLKDAKSANTIWCAIRKKIIAASGGGGAGAGEGAGAGAGSAPATPRKAAGGGGAKRTPKGKGKRKVEEVVGDGEGDGEGKVVEEPVVKKMAVEGKEEERGDE
ncbi:hypothetical protein KEM55_008114 [Ascosphaera atra]|nr:hypothetical protein KEM55_008114 [Ascosphaera atra]